jgi:hypothetical protein
MDGGIACNYPLNYCIESGKCPDEILGFKNKYSDNKLVINIESTLIDYLLNFLYKAIFSIHISVDKMIKNEVIFDANYLTLDNLRSALSNIEIRKELFLKGKQTAINFIENLQSSI